MGLFWIVIIALFAFFVFRSSKQTSKNGNVSPQSSLPALNGLTVEKLTQVLLRKGIITNTDLLEGTPNVSPVQTTDVQSSTYPATQPAASEHLITEQSHFPPSQDLHEPVVAVQKGAVQEESDFHFSGNWLTIVGVLAVLLGAGFFLKYSFENDIIGTTGRVILGVIAGLIFLGLGEFFNKKYTKYAHLLSGGGIGLLYLSVYGILYYSLIASSILGLAFMSLVTLVSIILSVRYDSKGIAALGLLGGFLTPVLFGPLLGEFLLLHYLIVLDIGLLALAYFKDWREMLWGSFIGTSLLVGSWIDISFIPSKIWMVVAYLAVFWLIFTAASLFHYYFHKRSPTNADLFLLVLVGLSSAGTAYGLLVRTFGENLHYASLLPFILAVMYTIFTLIGLRVRKDEPRLALYPMGMATLFLTLIFPIELDGEWLTVAWFVEAVTIGAIGSFLRNKTLLSYSIPIYGLAILTFISSGKMFAFEAQPIFNGRFFLYLVGIVSAFLVMYLFYRLRSRPGTPIMANEGDGAGAYFIAANILIGLLLVTEILTFGRHLQGNPMAYLPIINARFFLILFVTLYAFVVASLALWKGDERGKSTVVTFFFFANMLFGISLMLEISDFYRYIKDYTPLFNARAALLFLGILYTGGITSLFFKKLKALPSSRHIGNIFFVACNVLVLILGIMEINDYYTYVNKVATFQKESMFISLFLLLYGFVALVASIAQKFGLLRKISLAVLVIAVFKVFIVDIWVLSGLYRVAAFMSLGMVLLVVGYLYYRYKERIISFIKAEDGSADVHVEKP